MNWLVRPFLAFLLAVTLIGATVNDAAAGLTAEIAAVTDPCCEDECPDNPACGAACAMMARCGMQALWPLQASTLSVAEREMAGLLLIPDQTLPLSVAPDGVRRPPRI
ncbi:hypothetical protein [Gemmobacter denitrificans]|uniref:Uncharacterized protein n=1 Tax=Gemmobacter denitrificans TaxID=3123040 RepID=A0ABU8BXM2_9RHOB